MAGRKPGTPKTGGRQKGTPNKVTGVAKDIIASVADRLGGDDRLYEWVLTDPSNEKAFWTAIYPRLLPLQVQGDPNNPLISGITVSFVKPAG